MARLANASPVGFARTQWKPGLLAYAFQDQFAPALGARRRPCRWSKEHNLARLPAFVKADRGRSTVGPGHLQLRNRVARLRLACGVDPHAGAAGGSADDFAVDDLESTWVARVGPLAVVKVAVDRRHWGPNGWINPGNLVGQTPQSKCAAAGVGGKDLKPRRPSRDATT